MQGVFTPYNIELGKEASPFELVYEIVNRREQVLGLCGDGDGVQIAIVLSQPKIIFIRKIYFSI